jgi:hypothetical protein
MTYGEPQMGSSYSFQMVMLFVACIGIICYKLIALAFRYRDIDGRHVIKQHFFTLLVG